MEKTVSKRKREVLVRVDFTLTDEKGKPCAFWAMMLRAYLKGEESGQVVSTLTEKRNVDDLMADVRRFGLKALADCAVSVMEHNKSIKGENYENH